MSMKEHKQVTINQFVSIQFKRDSPKYLQIAQYIAEGIADNTLPRGAVLPPIRTLADALSVNSVTVVKAYEELKDRQLIHTRRGSGVYVGRHGSPANNTTLQDELYRNEDIELMGDPDVVIPPEALNLATSTPSTDLFPVSAFTASLNAVLERDSGDAFSYDESGGYYQLRETASELLRKRYGVQSSGSDIQVISGAQQGIDIAAKALVQPGDAVLVEDPTYSGAIAVFSSRGAKIITVKQLTGDSVRRACSAYRPKLIYCMSDYQNPTARSFSLDERREILQAARSFGSYIIEDDYASDLRYDQKEPVAVMKSLEDPLDGRVIYIKSFSKILMPGLRIGFLVPPGAISRQMLQAKHLSDIASSGLIQRAFEHYLRSRSWEDHLQVMITQYGERYDACCTALNQLTRLGCTFSPPGGGLHLWITLPETMSARRVYQQAALKGVIITPGEVFRAGSHFHDHAIRISIAACRPEDIQRGISILADVMSSKIRSTIHPFI